MELLTRGSPQQGAKHYEGIKNVNLGIESKLVY